MHNRQIEIAHHPETRATHHPGLRLIHRKFIKILVEIFWAKWEKAISKEIYALMEIDRFYILEKPFGRVGK